MMWDLGFGGHTWLVPARTLEFRVWGVVMRVTFPRLRVSFWVRYKKDTNNLGSVLESPYLWTIELAVHLANQKPGVAPSIVPPPPPMVGGLVQPDHPA